MILKMAYRNIFRNKKRNALTLSVMLFGISLAIFYDGLIQGYIFQSLELYKKTDLGYYKIYGKDYYKNREDFEKTEYTFDGKITKTLLQGKKYSERLSFTGTITIDNSSIPVFFLGVNPNNEETVFNRKKDMIFGEFVKDKNDIVIGSNIAKEFNLKVGDYISLVGRTVEKSINAYDLKITGIIKTENSIINKSYVFINLDFAKEFMLTDKINEIVVGENLSKKELDALNSYDLISTEEEMKEIIDLIIYKGKAAGKSMMFVLLLAAVGIANTMLMSMLEREKEIGIMLANGMEPKDIKMLFLLEGFILGVIGSGIGVILGLISVLYSKYIGIPLPTDIYENMDLNLVTPSRMYAIINVKTYVLYGSLGVVLASISSYYAASRGAKIEPLDVLRD